MTTTTPTDTAATPRPGAAALFDIDGTLVDSNYLHIEAWSHAFSDLGLAVDTSRLHRTIGMDSAKLLEALLGDDAERLSDQVKDLHTGYYETLMDRLRPFRGAREILQELDSRGVKVVLATSAPENELAELKKVLDVDETLTAVTSSEDVGTAKPEPDLVEVALDRSGADASAAVFVGDAVWDFVAARKVGLTCVGVLTGGYSRAELEEAGAAAVYDDVAQLLEQLESSPLAALWA
jgi:HAD superfamily hydrolase (TIGR01509 family)